MELAQKLKQEGNEAFKG